ncbi:hypothetical protein [Pedobacter nanyangensis]|uniref:hypothetical protein n=1 Tax=Pedobacter nanyangensis TaxID=1562389 RepID=UPI000DE551F9|nr:hypothetical protein [Pedobacter nanyangensis]
MRNNLPLFMMALFFLSCKNEKSVSGKWKYQQGHHLGDWLDIEKNVSISNNTIYQKDSAIAKFSKIESGYFGNPTKLHIADLKTNKIGIYIAK